MTQPTSSRPGRPPSRREHDVLDPCTLGRPIHLLHAFTAQWKEDMAEFFVRDMNRRYRASFDVGAVTLYRAGPIDVAATRWQVHADSLGRIGCAIERRLLLCILAYRYGDPALHTAGEHVPETATEERLAATLAARLVGLLAQRIDALDPAGEAGAAEPRHFAPVPTPRSAAGTWMLRVELRETALALDGVVWFTLDEAWMGLLLRHIAPQRESRPREAAPALAPLPARLQLALVARLLEKQLTLGELLDLEVGDVIPIRLGAADVLIDDSRIYTAAVAEHGGKLCLTSFESVD